MGKDSFMFAMIVAVFIGQAHSQQLQPAQHGFVVSLFNDFISNRAAIISFGGLSKIKCAAECSKRTGCHSFFYTKLTNKCQLHFTVLNWYTSGAKAFPGYRYYLMQKEKDFSGGCPSWAIQKNYKYKPILKVCYLFYTTPLKWNAAWEVCANDGGHLLYYTDQATHDWVVTLVSGTQIVFIDGYDENNNDNFKNYKNELVTDSFWMKTHPTHQPQPNNWGGNEDCIILYQPYQYQWADAGCYDAYPFVCQVDHYMG